MFVSMRTKKKNKVKHIYFSTLGIRIDHKNRSSDLMMTSVRLVDVSYDWCTTSSDWYSDSQKNKYSFYSGDCLAWGEKIFYKWHGIINVAWDMSVWEKQFHLIFTSLKRLKQKIKWFDKMNNQFLPLKIKHHQLNRQMFLFLTWQFYYCILWCLNQINEERKVELIF